MMESLAGKPAKSYLIFSGGNMNDCPACEMDYAVEEKRLLASMGSGKMLVVGDYAADASKLLKKIQILDRMRKELKLPDTYRRASKKVGRNEQCPCGSDLKYKKCCGK